MEDDRFAHRESLSDAEEISALSSQQNQLADPISFIRRISRLVEERPALAASAVPYIQVAQSWCVSIDASNELKLAFIQCMCKALPAISKQASGQPIENLVEFAFSTLSSDEHCGVRNAALNLCRLSIELATESTARVWAERWLRLRKNPSFSCSSLLALLNLAGCLVIDRPFLLPQFVTALLDVHESSPKYLSQWQVKSLQHALKLHLIGVAKLDALPNEILPLIDEALIELGVGKMAVVSKSLSRRKAAAVHAQVAKDRERLRRSRAQEDEEELERAGKEADDDIASTINVPSLPIAWIVEMILKSLEIQSFAAIQAACSIWRPPVAQTAKRSQIRDPRLQRVMPAQEKPAEPTAKESEDLSLSIFLRLLHSENLMQRFRTRDRWAAIITKLAISLTADTSTSFVKQAFFNFVFEDVQRRIDLAIFWLHREWIDIQSLKNQPADRSAGYSLLFRELLERLRSVTNSDIISQFLTDAPTLMDGTEVIDLLRSLLYSESNAAIGIDVVRQLLRERPATRPFVMPLLLDACFVGNQQHPDLRRLACDAAMRYFFADPLLVEAALKRVSVYVSATSTLARTAHNTDFELLGIDSENGPDDLFYQCTDLFFALFCENASLAANLPAVYCDGDDLCKSWVRFRLAALLQHGLVSQETQDALLDLLQEYPDGSEALLNRIILFQAASDRTRSIVLSLVSGKRAPYKILLPLLVASSINSQFFKSTYLIPLLKESFPGSPVFESEKLYMQQLISLLASPALDLFTPITFLVHCHMIEAEIGLRCAVEITQVCLEMQSVFTPQVISQALHNLLERENATLPTLFMRTLVQTVTMYRSLHQTALNILSKLFGRKLWTQKQQWDGAIRVLRLTLPNSVPLLLQLPVGQFGDFMKKSLDLVEYLRNFISQQPPSLQMRLVSQKKVLDELFANAGQQ